MFFILWLGLKRKHNPVYIISETKCSTNLFIWWSGLKTWFHADCLHNNYQMQQKVFLFRSMVWKCFLVYIISHKCTANISVWCSGLKTLSHGDYWLYTTIYIYIYSGLAIFQNFYIGGTYVKLGFLVGIGTLGEGDFQL